MSGGEGWSRRAAVAGLAASATPFAVKAASTRIPLRQQAGKLWVPVTVNGVAAEAILDTGASRSSLDAAFAAQAGIATRGRFTGQMIQGRVPGAYARGVKVRLGDQVVDASQAVAVDYGPLSRSLGRPLQVVLGRELFETFVVVVDVEHGEAEVLPRQGFTPPANALLIPLRPARGRMAAPVVVEDQSLWAMVDIGNDLPLILSPSPAARRLLQGRPVSTALIGGEGSSVVAQIATARRLEFGGFALPPAPFQVAPRGLGADANLGLPVLRRFRLTLDFGGRRMWLEPGLNLAFPFPRDRTGLNGFIDGGTLRILYVARGGPAERAGFRAGDIVTAIDGENAAVANAALAGAPAGRTLDFTLADGSHRRLTLADFY